MPQVLSIHTHYDAQLFGIPIVLYLPGMGLPRLSLETVGLASLLWHSEARERAMLSMTRVEAIPLASMRNAVGLGDIS